MERPFVKTVQRKGKLYFYLAQNSDVHGKTVQRIIRPLTPEQAKLLGFRAAGSYDSFSTVLRLPISEVLSAHPHEHTIQVRIWGQVDSSKTLICPSRVILQSSRVPVAEFHLPIPAASRPVLSICVTSSCSGDELIPPSKEQDIQTDGLKPSAISAISKNTETSEKSSTIDRTESQV